jgi:hypothetical protein
MSPSISLSDSSGDGLNIVIQLCHLAESVPAGEKVI